MTKLTVCATLIKFSNGLDIKSHVQLSGCQLAVDFIAFIALYTNFFLVFSLHLERPRMTL